MTIKMIYLTEKKNGKFGKVVGSIGVIQYKTLETKAITSNGTNNTNLQEGWIVLTFPFSA